MNSVKVLVSHFSSDKKIAIGQELVTTAFRTFECCPRLCGFDPVFAMPFDF